MNPRSFAHLVAPCLALCTLLTPCNGSAAHAQSTTTKDSAVLPKGLPQSLILNIAPSDAKGILAAKPTAKKGDPIVLRGQIGGSKDPFTPKRAAFTLVDTSLALSLKNPDGTDCRTPWDFCTHSAQTIAANSATIQVTDENGRVAPVALAGVGGLKPGGEVIIVGVVDQADGKASLVINATGIYIKDGPLSLPEGFFLPAAPANASAIKAAKPTIKPGDEVTLRGRIGGSTKPFVDGRAMFTLIDMELKPCNANPDDKCVTPWDYCCDTRADILACAATIQVSDPTGMPIKLGLKGRAGLKELSEVIVVGKAIKADGKALVVNATGVYVQ